MLRLDKLPTQTNEFQLQTVNETEDAISEDLITDSVWKDFDTEQNDSQVILHTRTETQKELDNY